MNCDYSRVDSGETSIALNDKTVIINKYKYDDNKTIEKTLVYCSNLKY